MTDRRSWTQEQDKALKYLKDVEGVKKWSQISQRLEFEFNIQDRNGKQCRQRYTNHLNSSIIQRQMTVDDEQAIFRLHNEIGNRWSLISKQLIGRTDNQIKNHFHSKLRRAIRKLNKSIKQHFHRSIRPIKLSIIYKVVEASDYRFSKNYHLPYLRTIDFNALKNLLFQYAGGAVPQTNFSNLKAKEKILFLVNELNTFENIFKNSKSQYKQYKGIRIKARLQKKNNSQCNDFIQNENFLSGTDQRLQNNENPLSIIMMKNPSPNQEINFNSKSFEQTDQFKEKFSTQSKTNSLEFIESDTDQIQNFQNCHFDSKLSSQSQPSYSIKEYVFEQIHLNKKSSSQSLESLKQYDDILDESEKNLVLKIFGTNQDIEAGLFQ